MELKRLNMGSWLVAAPSQAGKSSFVKNLIKHREEMFYDKSVNIMYAYNTWSEGYKDLLKDPDVIMVQELPTQEQLEQFYSIPGHKIIVFNDLLLSLDKQDLLDKLYTVDGHHNNISPIVICQSLFGNELKLISQNCHYFVLFKSQHNLSQVVKLASQIWRTKQLKSASR